MAEVSKAKITIAQTRLMPISGLIAGTTYIISTYNTSFTFQRPIETSVLTLLTTGVFILLSCRVTSLNVDELTASHPQSYALTPHIDKTKTHASRRRNASFNLGNARPLGTRRVRAIAVAIVVAVCLRVEILRRVINNSQCSKQSPEVSLMNHRMMNTRSAHADLVLDTSRSCHLRDFDQLGCIEQRRDT